MPDERACEALTSNLLVHGGDWQEAATALSGRFGQTALRSSRWFLKHQVSPGPPDSSNRLCFVFLIRVVNMAWYIASRLVLPR